MSHADKALLALTDKGAMRMDALKKATKCGFISTVVRQLEGAGKVKVEGKHNAIVYLPGQDITKLKDGAPPQADKPAKKKRKNAGKAKRKSPRKRDAAADEEFIPGLTADGGMVAINKGDAPPIVFSPEQTEKIATLLFAHFDA